MKVPFAHECVFYVHLYVHVCVCVWACVTGVSEVLPCGATEFVVERGDGSGGGDPGLH